jgi:glycosyltransferase involved in cell wall biosynthesis
MKVIFVASGNKTVGKVSSFVQSQYDSLVEAGLDMILFPVVGHGAIAHLRAAIELRRMIRKEQPDVVHAHYSVCGHVAAMARVLLQRKPKLVVSILGSFPTHSRKWRLVRFCIRHIWDKTIVKSQRTARQLGEAVSIIPNGVNLDMFCPQDHLDARASVGFETDKSYIIWCSNPDRLEKNYALAQTAVEILKKKQDHVELLPIYNKTPQEVVRYMNAADCLLLTSVQEGSPNVIKEAMACNCTIVSTDVGDVRERLTGLDGCYILPEKDMQSPDALANLIGKAICYGKRIEGYNRIINDELTTQQIAKRIMACYE